MSKLSVRPDTNNAPPLKPTPFPFPNINNFKISEVSSESNSRSRAFEQPSDVKFMTSPQIMPNLFQYNDRSKLILSSDEEDIQKQDDKGKPKERSKLLTIEPGKQKNDKNQMEEEVLSPKFNVATQKKVFPVIEETQFKTNQKEKGKQTEPAGEKINNEVKQGKRNAIERVDKPLLKQIQKENEVSQHEQDISRTDAILEVIQPEQKNVVIITEAYQPLNESKSIPVTPGRRKRNKIFDQSAKRDLSYLSSSRNNPTPTKEIQTESRYLNDKIGCSRSRIESAPQVKALNILDKLVDQIGSDKYLSSSKYYCESDYGQNNIFLSLSEFNQMSLQEILKIQNISDISIVAEPAIASRIQTIHEKADMWKERLSKSIVDISFTNTVEYEIIKKFEKICQNIDATYNMFIGYKQTTQRLIHLQRRLEEYVDILHDHDSKRLYSLIKQLNFEIDRMKQIKVKCGNYKLEKMYCQYLRKQIGLLEEIKGDFENNFMNDYPLLSF